MVTELKNNENVCERVSQYADVRRTILNQEARTPLISEIMDEPTAAGDRDTRAQMFVVVVERRPTPITVG